MAEGMTTQAMQQTIDQLRQNAKSHKKTVDKLATKVSVLTQERDELKTKQKTKWSTLFMAAAGCFLFGFLFTLGALCAYGWLSILRYIA